VKTQCVNDPQISVIIPTRNRAPSVRSTLESLAGQDFAYPWELLLVDNGSTDDTKTVASAFCDRLPLSLLNEAIPGKSRSLNRALEHAKGHLIAFTDDDVHVSRKWLSELHRAAAIFPEASVFCGPVTPVHPPSSPSWLRTHLFSSALFARFEPTLAEGVLPAPLVPFGPNFALRTEACAEMRFRMDLGPSDSRRLMCEDTEFVERFRKRGAQFIYVPSAWVEHHIRGELYLAPNQYNRAFNLGRSLLIAGKPIVCLRTFAFSPNPEVSGFEHAVILNFYLGELCQLDIHGDAIRFKLIRRLLESLGWHGDAAWLGADAEEWLRQCPPSFAALSG
jgi:glycosyltransferase involved in cell wall biosynthesis